jgi:hypothetical protein
MPLHPRRFFNSSRDFVVERGKHFAFIAAFYSIWFVFACFENHEFGLTSFARHMIGAASLDGYDVSARVSLFYKCAGILFLGFFVISIFAWLADRWRPLLPSSTEISVLNYSALAGCVLFLFKATSYNVSASLELIYLLHKLMLVALVIRPAVHRVFTPSVYEYGFMIILSVACYFLVYDVTRLSGSAANPDIYTVVFVIAALFIITAHFLHRKYRDKVSLNKIAYLLFPLCFLPLVSILKDEFYFVLRNRGVELLTQLPVFIILLFFLSAFVFFRYRRSQKAPVRPLEDQLSRTYIPAFIFSILAYTHYNYQIRYSEELYESANNYLPVMELRLFGVVPVIEKLSGHLFSGYFFMFIYAALNGLTGLDLTLYDFMYIPVSLTLLYYLVRQLSGNAFVGLFAVLVFPFAGVLVNTGFTICALGLLALSRVLQGDGRMRNYLLFFLALLFLLFWKIDVGVAALVVMPLLLIYYYLPGTPANINWRKLGRAFLFVFVPLVVLVLIWSLYRNVNLFYKLKYAMHYCASAQSYGFSIIGPSGDPKFRMQYFIFPVLVCFITIALVIQYKKQSLAVGSRSPYLALLYLCLTYFAIFNRGLTRHGFIEGLDDYSAAFPFLILSAAPFVFLQDYRHVSKFLIFCGLSFFLIHTYRFPHAGNFMGELEQCFERTVRQENRPLSNIKTRFSDLPEKPLERYQPFIDFIGRNTTNKQTFLEFSNKGLLYYFTRKETPSYFYHNPSCSHDDFLQKQFINDLKEFDTPYLAFSEMNVLGYDFFDDVPHQLRHFRIAEHYYNNFVPYIIAGKICVWRRKDVPDKNRVDTIISVNGPDPLSIPLTVNRRAEKKYLLKIASVDSVHILHAVSEVRIAANENNLNIEFVTTGLHEAYCMIPEGVSPLKISSQTPHRVNGIQVLECDMFPDFYSDRHYDLNLERLPYVWGTFGEEAGTETILLANKMKIAARSSLDVSIPANLDRSHGNTVLVTCSGVKRRDKMTLSFSKTGSGQTNLHFELNPEEQRTRYAFRASCFYKWHSEKPDRITLHNGSEQPVTIENVEVVSGD